MFWQPFDTSILYKRVHFSVCWSTSVGEDGMLYIGETIKVKETRLQVPSFYLLYMPWNFKNATFYVDCFLYWVDVMLFPIQDFILTRDKQQLTVKRILLRPFILTLPWR